MLKQSLRDNELKRQDSSDEVVKSNDQIFKLFNEFKLKKEEENSKLLAANLNLEEQLVSCLKNIEVLTSIVNQNTSQSQVNRIFAFFSNKSMLQINEQ